MIKKILCITFALILCAVSLGANAESDVPAIGVASETPFESDGYSTIVIIAPGDRANYMTIDKFQISSPSNGKLKIEIELSTTETMQALGATMIKIQHWNGSSWESIWSTSDHYSYNTTSFTYSHTFSGATSGDYYRLRAELSAVKSWYQMDIRTLNSTYIPCK